MWILNKVSQFHVTGLIKGKGRREFMAFSTTHYYVKPIVPPIKRGFSFNGIKLSNFDARVALLLSASFVVSSRFYYENDSKFSKKLNEYTRALWATREEFIRLSSNDFRHGRSSLIDNEVESERIEITLNTIIDEITSPTSWSCSQPSNEVVATPKELNLWLKKTVNQRKRKIQNVYPRKKYFEFNSFLNACNDFLKSLGQQSLKLTGSLNLFFEIGSDLDWFLLNITECDYHKSTEFRKLFSSNVALSNDFVAISGIFTILKQPNVFELYLANEVTFMEKLEHYKDIFRQLLLGGNRIIDLETLRITAEKEVEAISIEREKNEYRKEKLDEIQSMHDVAVDRKIHDIQ